MSTIALTVIAGLLWFIWRQLSDIADALSSLRNIAEQNHRRNYGKESQKA